MKPKILIFILILFTLSSFAEDKFEFALLKHSGDYLVRKNAIKPLMSELMVRTSIEAGFNPSLIDASSERLFNYPMIFLMGSKKFQPFSKAAIENLRKYLVHGGLLVIDNNSGQNNGEFDQSVHRLVKRIYPSKNFEKLPLDHTVYRTFYLMRKLYFGGRVKTQPYLTGIEEGDRSSIIYSMNDIAGAWQKRTSGLYMYDCLPGGEEQRRTAFKFGINVIMNGMKVNYKKDAVHVKTLLKRRKFARPPWIK